MNRTEILPASYNLRDHLKFKAREAFVERPIAKDVKNDSDHVFRQFPGGFLPGLHDLGDSGTDALRGLHFGGIQDAKIMRSFLAESCTNPTEC